jgi:hypothetical protein
MLPLPKSPASVPKLAKRRDAAHPDIPVGVLPGQELEGGGVSAGHASSVRGFDL